MKPLTPEQKHTFDVLFESAAKLVTENAGKVLFDAVARVYSHLTWDERIKFCVGVQEPQFVKLAKTLLVACEDSIDNQFNAEAIKAAVKSVKRIRRERGC